MSENIGDNNMGGYNTGNINVGIFNTGDANIGSRNTGNYNTGDANVGECNCGRLNTGSNNSGNRNVGDNNTGNRNTGSHNTGDKNTGSFNAGDNITGFFCTETPKPMLFDKPVDMTFKELEALIPDVSIKYKYKWVEAKFMTDEEKIQSSYYITTGGFLKREEKSAKEAFQEAWRKMSTGTKRQFILLPNFDEDKFKKCTGVDIRLDPDLNPDVKKAAFISPNTVIIDGKTYKVIEVF